MFILASHVLFVFFVSNLGYDVADEFIGMPCGIVQHLETLLNVNTEESS